MQFNIGLFPLCKTLLRKKISRILRALFLPRSVLKLSEYKKRFRELEALRCFDTIQSLCRRSRSILMCVLEIIPELISSLQNSILSFIFGEFEGSRFAEFQKEVKIVGLYIKLKTCSRLQKIVQNNYFDWNKIYFT